MYRFHRIPEGYSFSQVDFFFKAEHWEGNITNCEPDKCDELKFYSLQALPKNIAPFIRSAWNAFKKKNSFLNLDGHDFGDPFYSNRR